MNKKQKWVMNWEMSDNYLGMNWKELFMSVQMRQVHVKSESILSLYFERQGIQ
jgi:hypothetical protein